MHSGSIYFELAAASYIYDASWPKNDRDRAIELLREIEKRPDLRRRVLEFWDFLKFTCKQPVTD